MLNILMTTIGTLFSCLWIFLYIKSGKKYDALIERVDEKEYFGKQFFSIGFYVIEKLQINAGSSVFQKKMNRLSQMYGKKIGKQILLTDLASQISYSCMLLPLGLLLSVMMKDSLFFFLIVLLLLFLVIYPEVDKNSKLEKRKQRIVLEFPHMLSQMALLVNAGMPIKEVLEVSARKREGILYQEMQVLVDDMKNGIPDYEALAQFSDRCGVDCIRKFSSLLIQNVKKGSSELAQVLLELSGEIWRNRVNSAKEEGEKASAKLMIPILIIFAGILVMVMVPIFKNVNF